MIRDELRKQGYFLHGVVSLDSAASRVDTFGREAARVGVPTHPSDDNYSGVTNNFLTRQHGDMPAPAGTFPWV